ncbi:hypothetical protein B0H67DRAFT_550411 [Lasiosphaeris hirsuta]|uniref:Uncharacterized protein n=1 Tax=Lasiosphaeris hirsuta TaxID=260670 RepID=A0AA40AZ59_9PEZI|nr:hypothetical protein B0H67DRAFT_550411 [Lasiosphaeris hirsuta]
MLFGTAAAAFFVALLGLGHCLEAALPRGVGLALYAKKSFYGRNCTVKVADLKEGACFNLPNDIRIQSVKKSGPRCCLLYRSPCPSMADPKYGQAPGFLHQRVFGDINDLAPYGFAGLVRSVVCPSNDVCNGLLLDETWSPDEDVYLRPYWLDVLNIPGREEVGP